MYSPISENLNKIIKELANITQLQACSDQYQDWKGWAICTMSLQHKQI